MSASTDFATAVSLRIVDADVPSAEHDLDALNTEIERLDADILAAVERRTQLAQTVGSMQMAGGRTGSSDGREMSALQRFSTLGREGHTLGMLLLRMGRGRSAA
ncbi:MAG: chorismate mutase [Rhodococcus sp. (in: high G+C Gram-positive bacteria)]